MKGCLSRQFFNIHGKEKENINPTKNDHDKDFKK